MLVKQADNTLAILEYFAEHRAPATVAELAQHFGWARSSAFNLVGTLAERGYLYEPRLRGSYYPTPRWLAMARRIAEADPVPEALVRVIEYLVRETGETAWVAGASGLHVVVLEARESPQLLRYAAQPGTRLPIHVTGSGQALMALMPTPQRDALLARISYDAFNRNSPTSADAVRAQIEESRARGWFMSASAYSSDLAGVALPVSIGSQNFAVTVAGPEARVLPRLAQLADDIRGVITAECGAQSLPLTATA
ncbi:IclR family transcriptional regulator [Rhodalgimonas zhirmunskyi]|uniref:IclR family transcriptional regulator n=1 Tax=Rhodalgimonas zhirmunskyi TaxID=2964767 RepID=A0AAJ1X5D9_9RHOB|nr:IclR family transcriptional regulator [Rhodoalgimonas zhirmunskyi]MDQ2095153.1 IclR family transcriptional regulator [Rhodoalgimonas zhirmunskyi]